MFVWLVIVLMCGTADAAAQEIAGTFDQLRVLVKPGDRLRITDNAGGEIAGALSELRSSSLTVTVGGRPRDIDASAINTIRQRRSDPLGNGARWGFGIGAALGLLGGIAVAAGDGSSGAVIPIAALAYGALGAGAGVGIDGMISGEQVIYARRSARVLSISVPLARQR
jgi:hypothetical protein